MPERVRVLARFRAFAALLAAAAAVPIAPAGAAPRDARVIAVFRVDDCAAAVCDPDRDPTLEPGAIVTGAIQIRVGARADLGLEWVRLEATYPGEARPYCIERWVANRALEFEAHRNWVTPHWTDPSEGCVPERCSGCVHDSPHKHGAIAENLPHTLRVVAREQAESVSEVPDDKSEPFEIRIQNPPSAAAWANAPTATGRSVDLQWRPNPEPDVVEYRFVRTDPDGRRTAYAVGAADPERQGCTRIATIAYRCTDRNLDGGGTYRYAVAAVRRAIDGERCKAAAGECLVGPLSASRTVSVAAAAAPSSSAPASEPSTRGSTAVGRAHEPAPLGVAPPPENAPELGDALAAGRTGPVAAAALLLIAVVALAGVVRARIR